MKIKPQLIILIVLFGITAYLFYAAYNSVKREMITDLNVQQAAYARQAARGIESFFNHYLNTLKFLSQNNSIINLDEQGKGLIKTFFNNNSSDIKAVTRIDSKGRIVYSYPANGKIIGRDISTQNHVREIMRTHKPVLSDVFEAVQGFRSIALHVPVFRGNKYAGTIAILISFDNITKNFLETIKIGEEGYTSLLSPEGVELYCPVPGHTGKTIYETSGAFPEVISLAEDMRKGKQGEATYVYNRIRGNVKDTVKKQVVYMQIPLINTYWSIAVATPEDHALLAMKSFRSHLFLIIAIMVIICILISFIVIRAWTIFHEEIKRKRIESALKENEEFLRMITDGIQDAIRIVDLQTLKYTYANNYALNRFGLPEQGFIGSSLGFNLEDEEKQRLSSIMKDELEHDAQKDMNRSRLIELREKSKLTGEIITTENKASFIRDKNGKPIAILVISRDITSNKRAEYELRKTGERYKTIIENIEEGYYEVDLKGNMVFCNVPLGVMLGYKQDELIGINNRLYMDEENAKKVFATFNRVYRTHVPSKAFDWELIKKDSVKIYVETSVSLITDNEGNSVGFRGIIRDVTHLRQAEMDRRMLEERLRRAEKMEAIGTLAGGVAHDLNNVLGVLVGYSELLLEKISETSPMRKYVDNILHSGQRGAAIIQDLLTLARRGVAISEVVNLNTTITEYLRTPEFETLKSFHQYVNFTVCLEDDLLNINGSPVHLSKTIMNLVSNAAEACATGGEVIIRTENCSLDNPIRGFNDMPKGDYVVLSVSDSGIGIPAKDVGKIFEPFYTKKVMGRSGTGLGLAVVWGTVKDHNGYIDVQSEEGKGSTFTIYFPVSRKERVLVIEAKSHEEYLGNGELILVVDDVKEQRELATSMLERLGYRVTTAPGGEEAVTYLRANKVDLVVLDMIMVPGMDGLETYEKIIEINPQQKTIIVSGFSETDRVKRAQELGAGIYVRKPYILKNIGSAIRKELDK